jgi:uncharacterized protein YecT (DUF1311 family)
MEWPILKDIGLFSAGLVVAPIAYFAKRWIERKPEHENLEIKERVLQISKQMKEQNLSPEQLKELEDTLRRKARSQKTVGEADRMVVEVLQGFSEKPTTQFELDQTSFQDFEKTDLELKHLLERLGSIVDPPDAERLDIAQKAWREFRDKQARFAAGFHEGGTIQPLIYNVELHAVTKARLKELTQIYDEFRTR